MADNGWIKLHRKIRENPIYQNSKAVHIWIECLLRASHSGGTQFLGRGKVELSPGQFCMGREEFGQSIGISGSTVWFWINQFELDSMVDIKKTPKGSIVTIKRWGEYQKLTADLTIKKQQKNTNKNVKNVKNNINMSVKKIFNHYQKKISSRVRLTDKARRKIQTRLKTYKEEELLLAISNFSQEGWWMEHNGGRGVAWFFNSDDRIEQFLNFKQADNGSKDFV